jgi:S1-C subfamily serine protease
MEDLNKTQIVLLCLLVSFVTSIGTGIITVSLLQEAPQTVTQTINRVVERTVETIVPQETPGVVTREITVVVKEEDLIVDAIKKNRNSLVWISESQTPAEAETRVNIKGVGVIINRNGTILADKRFINEGGTYHAVFFSDGRVYPLTVATQENQSNNFVFLTPTVPAGESSVFTPVTIGNSSGAQLGQTVIAMGGKEKDSVAIGRISSVNLVQLTAGETASSTRATASIEIDTPLRDLIAGSILINLNGEMVGFENYDAVSGRESLYTAINIIKGANSGFFQ